MKLTFVIMQPSLSKKKVLTSFSELDLLGKQEVEASHHSYMAESLTPFPPTTGWKDENDDLIPSITVSPSGTIPYQIYITLAEDTYREEDEDEETKTLESELGQDYLGTFEREKKKQVFFWKTSVLK